jgi:tetratricopeptide (TPR) repeat protein
LSAWGSWRGVAAAARVRHRVAALSILIATCCPWRLQAQDVPAPQASDMHRPGAASQTQSSAPEAAVEHYQLGRKWYLEGRYRDALVELKAALEYDPNSADLIYNVARVYENLGEMDEAIAHYQRYLEHLPPEAHDERDRTDKTIRRLQGAKRELAQTEAERNSAAQQAASHAGRADFVFWLTGGAAVALFAAGGVSGVLALKKNDQVASFVVGMDGTFDEREKLAKQANNFALAADLLLAGGAVALTSAALLYFLRDSEPEASEGTPKLSVSFSGNGAQLGMHGTF